MKDAEFSEIKQTWGLLCRSRSFKVTEFGTNQKLIYDFLLVTNSKLHHILYRFWDIAFDRSKIAIKSQILFFYIMQASTISCRGQTGGIYIHHELRERPALKIWPHWSQRGAKLLSWQSAQYRRLSWVANGRSTSDVWQSQHWKHFSCQWSSLYDKSCTTVVLTYYVIKQQIHNAEYTTHRDTTNRN